MLKLDLLLKAYLLQIWMKELLTGERENNTVNLSHRYKISVLLFT